MIAGRMLGRQASGLTRRPICGLVSQSFRLAPAGAPLRRALATSMSRSTIFAPSRPARAETKPYYLTTPIFYVNADPHIGHLYTSVLADVLVRWSALRHQGRSPAGPLGAAPELSGPLFCTGTDEHGLKIQKTAEDLGVSPRTLCDQVSTRFRHLADVAGAASSTFIRTTEPRHAVAVQQMWRLLKEKGMIYKGEHQGWYAVSDETFYPETHIADFEDPKTGEKYKVSSETGKRVEWSSEENYKFRLSAMIPQLIEWIEKCDPIQPTQFREKVLSELRTPGEVEDLSISRPRSRLQWGIPVPDDEHHVVYVWMDALVNYLTAAGFPGEHKAWPADVHVIGKDILRFHTIYWPAFLMAAGMAVPRAVLVHSHWTVAGSKMGKSVGNVIDPFWLLNTGAGLMPEHAPGCRDVARYLLAKAGGSLASDADYSPEVFASMARKDLRNQLGNLTSRMLTPKILARTLPADSPKPSRSAPIDMVIPQPTSTEGELPELSKLRDGLDKLPDQFEALIDQYRFTNALDAVFEVVARNNEYVQALAPWSSATSQEEVRRGVYWTLETLRVAGNLLSPFMPERMAVLLTTLGEPVPASSALEAGERPKLEPSPSSAKKDTWTDVRTRRPEARLTLRGEKVVPLFMIPAEEP